MEISIPSRCTGSLPDDLGKEYLISEEKLDGSRYLFYIGGDPYGRFYLKNTFLSRRISAVDNKHVDRSRNLPHISSTEYPDLEGTVLDGEVMGNTFLETNSILNSNPDKAIAKQKEAGLLIFNVFDVLFFRGVNVKGLPLFKRRKILEEVVRRMNNCHVRAIPQVKGDIQGHFNSIIEKGGEGVIVKDIRMGYGQSWAKMKKSYEVSCIISGFKEGNNKYQGMIGSLALSVYQDGNLVEVGFASGFSDALRKEMSDNFSKFEGMVVDVFAQEVLKDKSSRLRHPTFYRLREDANPEDITMEKLKRDLKSKVKTGRVK